MTRSVGRVRRQPPPGKITAQPEMSLPALRLAGLQLLCYFRADCAPGNCLRYGSHGAGSAQGAASRRRPLYPRAPASNIAAARYLRLIPAGFGSGRGSVRAKHGPQPASMRAAPAFRERLSDVEAATPAVSATMVNKLTTSRTDRRPGKSQPPPGNKAALCLMASPGGAALTGPTGCEPVRAPAIKRLCA